MRRENQQNGSNIFNLCLILLSLFFHTKYLAKLFTASAIVFSEAHLRFRQKLKWLEGNDVMVAKTLKDFAKSLRNNPEFKHIPVPSNGLFKIKPQSSYLLLGNTGGRYVENGLQTILLHHFIPLFKQELVCSKYYKASLWKFCWIYWHFWANLIMNIIMLLATSGPNLNLRRHCTTFGTPIHPF